MSWTPHEISELVMQLAGISTVLSISFAIVVRIAIKPLMADLAKLREPASPELERRLAFLERRVMELDGKPAQMGSLEGPARLQA